MAAKKRAGKTRSDLKFTRSKTWPAEWRALLARFGGEPRKLAEALEISYQTLWRLGLQGKNASFETRVKIRLWCAEHGIRSPV